MEMSLQQAVIGTFGVTYDGSDPDERSAPARLRTLIDLVDGRLTVDVAGDLMGLSLLACCYPSESLC
jgi:hypothetical protein